MDQSTVVKGVDAGVGPDFNSWPGRGEALRPRESYLPSLCLGVFICKNGVITVPV